MQARRVAGEIAACQVPAGEIRPGTRRAACRRGPRGSCSARGQEDSRDQAADCGQRRSPSESANVRVLYPSEHLLTPSSTLIIKYQSNDRAVIQSRKLTESEVRALERYPEIQNAPANLIGALVAARCCFPASFLLIAGSFLSNRAFFLDGTHSIFTSTPNGGDLKDNIKLGGSHSHRNGSVPDKGRTSIR